LRIESRSTHPQPLRSFVADAVIFERCHGGEANNFALHFGSREVIDAARCPPTVRLECFPPLGALARFVLAPAFLRPRIPPFERTLVAGRMERHTDGQPLIVFAVLNPDKFEGAEQLCYLAFGKWGSGV
jgi:hypothetical protein